MNKLIKNKYYDETKIISSDYILQYNNCQPNEDKYKFIIHLWRSSPSKRLATFLELLN